MDSQTQVLQPKIAFLLFNNFTALDVIGPYEVLSRAPQFAIHMVGLEKGIYRDLSGLQMYADSSLDEIKNPDILVIPGGFGVDSILNNQDILRWIYSAHITSKWTVSVCSGALLLGAAGILKNHKATTHWNRKKQLAEYGAIIKKERYVQDGKIITAAGVSAGIDMALYLLSILTNDNFAKSVQLGIEYDPKPPFDCGSPEKAPKELVEKIRR